MEDTHKYKELLEILNRNTRFLIVAHQKPDLDTLGASTALAHWLIKQNKEVTLFCLDIPGKHNNYLDHYFEIQNDPDIFKQTYDVIIVLDSGSLEYCGIGDLIKQTPLGYILINIDHHAVNSKFGDFNLVQEKASSTSEIIGYFFEINNIQMDSAMATSLMSGILFDTTYFTNSATNVPSLDLTGRLMAAGARTADIAESLLKNKDVKILRLWGTALARLKKNNHLNLAITYLKLEDLQNAKLGPNATEGISNFLGAVCGDTEITMILTQMDEKFIKGSIRSIKPDISKIARLFGGGGHKLASGFKIQGKIIETPTGFKII